MEIRAIRHWEVAVRLGRAFSATGPALSSMAEVTLTTCEPLGFERGLVPARGGYTYLQ
jgi:hypothetical protein